MICESIIPNPIMEDLIHRLGSFHTSFDVGLGESSESMTG